jgi:hypothetical protein
MTMKGSPVGSSPTSTTRATWSLRSLAAARASCWNRRTAMLSSAASAGMSFTARS